MVHVVRFMMDVTNLEKALTTPSTAMRPTSPHASVGGTLFTSHSPKPDISSRRPSTVSAMSSIRSETFARRGATPATRRTYACARSQVSERHLSFGFYKLRKPRWQKITLRFFHRRDVFVRPCRCIEC